MANYYTLQQIEYIYNSLTSCKGSCPFCNFRKLRNYIDECNFEEFQRQLHEDILPADIKHAFELKIKMLQKTQNLNF